MTQQYLWLQCGRALLLQRTARERFLEYTEVPAVPAKIVDAKTSVEESPLVVQITVSLAQCKSSSHMSCCDFGVPDDCSQEYTASGQCEEASFAFCFGAGTLTSCQRLDEDMVTPVGFTCSILVPPQTIIPY